MSEQQIVWLRGLAAKGGKGGVDLHNIDARALGRIADELERRGARVADLKDELDRKQHFHDRAAELQADLTASRARVAELEDRLSRVSLLQDQKARVAELEARLDRIANLECGLIDPTAAFKMFEVARDIAKGRAG